MQHINSDLFIVHSVAIFSRSVPDNANLGGHLLLQDLALYTCSFLPKLLPLRCRFMNPFMGPEYVFGTTLIAPAGGSYITFRQHPNGANIAIDIF